MAILTALLTRPYNGNINIFTDSQAAIDTFYKSKNLHSISPRKFNKINNNILWSTIHYIIKILSLKVNLHKAKAHSNDTFNDLAGAQAKIGRLHTIPTRIKHGHLPTPTFTLLWNDTILDVVNVLDRFLIIKE
ncbi:hypothetical protein RhiirA5_422606 [Rhizophagus irregularis]|uniref:RNase H type-1 domain-containing protein n=1 Tax=Rhizophagus irregularis TaxID=588596 RepID=A0A2I1FFG4_9GLOM|nr:hypothetical protein RhiirA5_422606 [Rhizophagus irregularis]PKC66520.1 hypothetical protein RhiirA1_459604 [Rhizophagus irregularis]PKY33067.1 hypothetical protein RhiirB3_451702 [Rhizophagus irregularis]CAB5216230.1 unnamed protein product [Rhizophagus irregularis]